MDIHKAIEEYGYMWISTRLLMQF